MTALEGYWRKVKPVVEPIAFTSPKLDPRHVIKRDLPVFSGFKVWVALRKRKGGDYSFSVMTATKSDGDIKMTWRVIKANATSLARLRAMRYTLEKALTLRVMGSLKLEW